MKLTPKPCKGKGLNKVWVKDHHDPNGGYWATFIKRGSRTAMTSNGRLAKRNRGIPAHVAPRTHYK
jgi:hypothetical protein